jgi:hypothetical protein
MQDSVYASNPVEHLTGSVRGNDGCTPAGAFAGTPSAHRESSCRYGRNLPPPPLSREGDCSLCHLKNSLPADAVKSVAKCKTICHQL